jgi:hypothetical protein
VGFAGSSPVLGIPTSALRPRLACQVLSFAIFSWRTSSHLTVGLNCTDPFSRLVCLFLSSSSAVTRQMHSRGVPEGQANGSAKILGPSTGGRNPLLLPIDGPASAESEDGMRQGFRIRQLTSRTRELNGQLGLLSRWQLTIGIVHVHVQLLGPCVTKSMRVTFLYRLCVCVCVSVSPHSRRHCRDNIARNGRYQIKNAG